MAVSAQRSAQLYATQFVDMVHVSIASGVRAEIEAAVKEGKTSSDMFTRLAHMRWKEEQAA